MKNWNTLVQASLHETVPPVLVRVVSQRGSAPRTAGARMLVREHDIAGTVGGGQFEGLAIETARRLQQDIIKEGTKGDKAVKGGIIRFSLDGVDDMDMVCGGELCLLLEVLGPGSQADKVAGAAAKAENAYKDFCLISFFSPWEDAVLKKTVSSSEGSLGSSRVKPIDDFLGSLPQGTFVPLWVDTAFCLAGTHEVVGTDYPRLYGNLAEAATAFQEPGFMDVELMEPDAEILAAQSEIAQENGLPRTLYCFVDPFPAPSVVHIFGGGHVSKALADCLAPLSLGVVVLEDRAEFIDQDRFPRARTVLLPSFEQEAVREYLEHVSPQAHHGIIIMTRGHAYDREVLAVALECGAGYVGMIGSKRKWVEVKRSLLAAGASESALDRVYTPIGLSIGAETPEEIAVSITAEIIAWRRGAEAHR